MMRRFQDYIENSSWDRLLEDDGRMLRRVCWVILAVAALYFAVVAVCVIARGPLG